MKRLLSPVCVVIMSMRFFLFVVIVLIIFMIVVFVEAEVSFIVSLLIMSFIDRPMIVSWNFWLLSIRVLVVVFISKIIILIKAFDSWLFHIKIVIFDKSSSGRSPWKIQVILFWNLTMMGIIRVFMISVKLKLLLILVIVFIFDFVFLELVTLCSHILVLRKIT